jgi:hypothetical protein
MPQSCIDTLYYWIYRCSFKFLLKVGVEELICELTTDYGSWINCLNLASLFALFVFLPYTIPIKLWYSKYERRRVIETKRICDQPLSLSRIVIGSRQRLAVITDVRKRDRALAAQTLYLFLESSQFSAANAQSIL